MRLVLEGKLLQAEDMYRTQLGEVSQLKDKLVQQADKTIEMYS